MVPPRHLVRPRRKGYPQILVTFHPPTPVDFQLRPPGDPLQHPVIDDTPSPRPVQVHHMQPLQPRRLKFPRHRQRILVVHGLAVVIALRQAHALPVDEVYGWYDVQGGKG